MTNEDKIELATVRRRVLEYRAQYNITQERFTELAHLSRWSVHKVENGKHVSPMTIIKVLRVIDNQLI